MWELISLKLDPSTLNVIYLVGGLEQPRWPKLSSSTAVLTNPGSVGSPVAGHGHGIPYEFW
mgnify:CR=1 FL=1